MRWQVISCGQLDQHFILLKIESTTKLFLTLSVQCLPLNRITLGQYKRDNNNRLIQLTDVSCVMLRYNGTSNIWLQCAADSIIRDPIKQCIKQSIIFGWGGDNKILFISNAKLSWHYLKDLKYTAVIAQNHKGKVITNL